MHKARLVFFNLIICLAFTVSGAEEARSQTNRTQAVQSICAKLGIGPGAVVADVGCGDGPDTMVFASIVGERGTVFAQEIEANKLKRVVETADKRGFHHVVAVLGQSTDPRLPDGSANLIYMNRVFHHFSRPEEMLKRMWADLKPGGFLVVVDQQKGPLTDWTPMEKREKEHHWTGETTVVRLAREAGFLFHDVLDGVWHEKQPFVLAFKKPEVPAKQSGDPDLPRALDVSAILRALPLQKVETGPVLFCGLNQGRAVLPELCKKLPANTSTIDLILEEWALSKEERPSETSLTGVETMRTEKGDLVLPAEIHPKLVLFVDAYHRLWHPVPLLRRLKGQLADSALVAVVDRKGPAAENRRLGGHNRRISPQLVIEDMKKAGLQLRDRLSAPAKDRFFLLFGM